MISFLGIINSIFHLSSFAQDCVVKIMRCAQLDLAMPMSAESILQIRVWLPTSLQVLEVP